MDLSEEEILLAKEFESLTGNTDKKYFGFDRKVETQSKESAIPSYKNPPPPPEKPRSKERFDLNSGTTQIRKIELASSPEVQKSNERPSFTTKFVSPRRQHKHENLPSMGLFYDNSFKIFSTNYLVKEIDALSIEVESFDIDFIYETLLQGITTLGFDKTSLTFSDFCFISFERKLDALGTYEVHESVDCPKCKKPSNFKFDFDKFTFKDLDPNKLKNLTRKFTFAYIDALGEYQEIEKTYSFKPLTIGDILDIFHRGLQYNDLAYLVYLIDVENKHELLENEFNPESINIEHRKILQEMDQLLFHGIEPKTVKCKNKIDSTKGGEKVQEICSHELTINFDIPSLIFPFSQD